MAAKMLNGAKIAGDVCKKTSFIARLLSFNYSLYVQLPNESLFIPRLYKLLIYFSLRPDM